MLLATLAASPAIAQEESPFPQTCTYEDARVPDGGVYEVDCTMRYRFTDSGVLYSFRFGGRSVVVEVSSEGGNGPWRPASINGQPALRLELWRGSYIAVTNDMQVSFDWRDRGAPKYPAN